ncbi:MAG: hypothetical protein HQL29_06270 [Candidatus Omnitrophica bacterium]|nr:hypothetical protein [Candidatus Omnitrophota bacterium]
MAKRDELKKLEGVIDLRLKKAESVNSRLKNILCHENQNIQNINVQPSMHKEQSGQNYLTEDAFRAQMEKFMSGYFETMGDKLSSKLSGMLKELGNLSGPVR